jgi:tetratricopeptide (TPR) repeat protein
VEQKGKRKAVDVNKEIREEYSDADVHRMAIKLVKTMKDKEMIKEEAKAAADSFKQDLANKDTQIEELSSCITNGYQYVTRKCEMIRNFDSGKREFWDEGKLVAEEDLTAKDHQLDLEDAEAANKAEMDEATRVANEAKTAELNAQAAKEAEEEALLSEEQKAQFDEFIKLGDADHKAKRYAEALVMYKAALNLKPNDKEANNKHLKVTNWLQREKEKKEANG